MYRCILFTVGCIGMWTMRNQKLTNSLHEVFNTNFRSRKETTLRNKLTINSRVHTG